MNSSRTGITHILKPDDSVVYEQRFLNYPIFYKLYVFFKVLRFYIMYIS